jgi:hypothetical protein
MSYRQLKIQKRVKGKLRRYKNLATFNKECAKSTRSRVHSGSVLCMLDNVRTLRDGSGMATVRTVPMVSGNDGKRGTWLLHFASASVMKRHLKGRVDPVTKNGRTPSLDGAKRRKRRR